jgi:hypothetical protein
MAIANAAQPLVKPNALFFFNLIPFAPAAALPNLAPHFSSELLQN